MRHYLPLKVINKIVELLPEQGSSARKVRKKSFRISASNAKERVGNKKIFLSGSELTRIFSKILSS